MNKPSMMQCALNYSHKPYADMTPDERSFLHYCEMVLGFIEMAVYVAKSIHHRRMKFLKNSSFQ